MTTTEIIPASPSAFMPALTIDEVIYRRNMIVQATQKIMVEGTDFGKVPGTDKPTLLKPGAEKLNTMFGLTPRPVVVKEIEDWSGASHGGEVFFYYWIRVGLWHGEALIAEADGSCNSMEKKYRYRWLPEHEAKRMGADLATAPRQGGRITEMAFAIDKAETGGKYGKPADYWQAFKAAIASGTAVAVKKKIKDGREFDAWEIDSTLYRVPNPDIADAANTILKMAQKRALIAATLLAVNASEFFTQDVEDLDILETNYTASPRTEPPAGDAPKSDHAPAVDPKSPPATDPLEAVRKTLQYATECLSKGQYPAADKAMARYRQLHETARGIGVDTQPFEFDEEDQHITTVMHNIKAACEAVIAQASKSH